jgi:hypothetical protein
MTESMILFANIVAHIIKMRTNANAKKVTLEGSANMFLATEMESFLMKNAIAIDNFKGKIVNSL